MRKRSILLGTVVASAAMLALAAPAYAHVTVSSPGAAPGGYAVLTFRVPTESDTASTTALKVQLPSDAPLASVLVQAHPGWSFTTKTVKLDTAIKTDDGDEISQVVSEIDWKADSAATAIKPGEFDQFLVSAGPLPKADAVTFKAIQTYSDGSQVDWTEVPAPGSTAEPEHPAPSLKLTSATATTTPVVTSSKSDSQTGPVVLGSIALAVAVIAAALGGVAFVRSRGRSGAA
ncbi:MAG TPA: YcnI family protein [Jatrophihabitantaceae bacterium]|nr:YcnI family protein [Jatrophihabitantaceae bacterium]